MLATAERLLLCSSPLQRSCPRAEVVSLPGSSPLTERRHVFVFGPIARPPPLRTDLMTKAANMLPCKHLHRSNRRLGLVTIPYLREVLLIDRRLDSSGAQLLSFCPFCGVRLLSSLRDQWFALAHRHLPNKHTLSLRLQENLRKLPAELRSERWWREKRPIAAKGDQPPSKDPPAPLRPPCRCRQLRFHLAETRCGIRFIEPTNEYVLIEPGCRPRHAVRLAFCPFCGGPFPPSMRVQWQRQATLYSRRARIADCRVLYAADLPEALRTGAWRSSADPRRSAIRDRSAHN